MKSLLEKLLPKTVDNNFPGKKLAFYALVPLTLLSVVRSCIHLLAPDGGAQSIASIPLDQYSGGASANIIAIFSQWGLSQLLLAAIYVLVLFRYRSLIPLCYAILICSAFGRFVIGELKPIETPTTAPGEAGNLPFLAMGVVLLVISLIPATTEKGNPK
ncbi:MAG: hypothetical protein AAFY34_08015 [Pseudomonadota bacterium]